MQRLNSTSLGSIRPLGYRLRGPGGQVGVEEGQRDAVGHEDGRQRGAAQRQHRVGQRQDLERKRPAKVEPKRSRGKSPGQRWRWGKYFSDDYIRGEGNQWDFEGETNSDVPEPTCAKRTSFLSTLVKENPPSKQGFRVPLNNWGMVWRVSSEKGCASSSIFEGNRMNRRTRSVHMFVASAMSPGYIPRNQQQTFLS